MTSSATVLIIISVIFAVLVIIASLYFLVYFQHPEDKWTAWWPKLVVVREELTEGRCIICTGEMLDSDA